MPFSVISIIYNPNSTGPSKALAKECAAALQTKLPQVPVNLVATDYAGHAEKLAYELALSSERPLIISSSGDGGYHEVVNGVLQAIEQGADVVAGLLPGGNANDHYHRLHSGDFIDAIAAQQVRTVDVLRLTGIWQGQSFSRLAHSYIGLGFTPWIGQQLTRASLNRLNEMWITFRSLLFVRSTHLIVDGKKQAYRSIVCTNIGRMAKFLNVAQESEVDDGTFEVSVLKRRSRLHMFLALFKASTLGLQGRQTKQFDFQTVQQTLVQLDGEVRKLDPQSAASVTIVPAVLRCIV